FLRRDGSCLWALVCGTPMFNEHGEFAGSLGMLADISDRKKAEEDLRQITKGARCILWHATVRDLGDAFDWQTEVANPAAAREVISVTQEPGQSLALAWQWSILTEDRDRIDAT